METRVNKIAEDRTYYVLLRALTIKGKLVRASYGNIETQVSDYHVQTSCETVTVFVFVNVICVSLEQKSAIGVQCYNLFAN